MDQKNGRKVGAEEDESWKLRNESISRTEHSVMQRSLSDWDVSIPFDNK